MHFYVCFKQNGQCLDSMHRFWLMFKTARLISENVIRKSKNKTDLLGLELAFSVLFELACFIESICMLCMNLCSLNVL